MSSSAATTSAPATSTLGKRPNQDTDDEEPTSKRPRHMPIKISGKEYVPITLYHPKTRVIVDLVDYEKLITSEKELNDKNTRLENDLNKIKETNAGLLKQMKDKEASYANMGNYEFILEKVKILEKTKEAQNNSIENYKKEIIDKNSTILSMKTSNDSLTKTNETLKKENDDLNQRLTKAKTTIQAQYKQLQSLIALSNDI